MTNTEEHQFTNSAMFSDPAAVACITANRSPGNTQKYSGTPAGNRMALDAAATATGALPKLIQQSLVATTRMCRVLFGAVNGTPTGDATL
jgi:hypothetical protein